jgi:hypothetical protein
MCRIMLGEMKQEAELYSVRYSPACYRNVFMDYKLLCGTQSFPVFKHHYIKACGGAEAQLHAFLTLAPDGG